MRTGHCAAALPAPADRAGKTTVGAGIGAPGLIGTDHVNPDVEVLLDQIDGVVIIYVCRSLIGKVWRRAAATSERRIVAGHRADERAGRQRCPPAPKFRAARFTVPATLNTRQERRVSHCLLSAAGLDHEFIGACLKVPSTFS
jgi:hypothetical protein